MSTHPIIITATDFVLNAEVRERSFTRPELCVTIVGDDFLTRWPTEAMLVVREQDPGTARYDVLTFFRPEGESNMWGDTLVRGATSADACRAARRLLQRATGITEQGRPQWSGDDADPLVVAARKAQAATDAQMAQAIPWWRRDLAQYAAQWADQFQPEHPAGGPAERFIWRYSRIFDIHDLLDPEGEASVATPEGWAAWLNEDDAAHTEDWDAPEKAQGATFYGHLSGWWETVEQHGAPVFVRGDDDAWHIWDGNHRAGVAFAARQRYVPAVVGLRIGP